MMPVWATDGLPFLIGLNDRPGNPHGLPDRLPFTLMWDDTLGLIRQAEDDRVADLLEAVYAKGSLLGTAMDDTFMGRCYADDMLRFVSATISPAGRRLLELGAGRGYLLRRLRDAGADVLGIEPGASNRPHWERHGVPVVEGMFPGDLPSSLGPFDIVIAHCVLEHVADPLVMLRQIRDRLTEGGVLCIAVPDCTAFIAAGDTAMLLHEHYSYFTAPVLVRLLAAAGFADVATRPAEYGGVLQATGVRRAGVAAGAPAVTETEAAAALAFGSRADANRALLAARLDILAAERCSLGLYCPARALNLLPAGTEARLFDDDAELHGRYYPTLPRPVESRDALVAEPVQELWIMSRSFGPRLAATLADVPALRATRIMTIGDMLDDGGTAK